MVALARMGILNGRGDFASVRAHIIETLAVTGDIVGELPAAIKLITASIPKPIDDIVDVVACILEKPCLAGALKVPVFIRRIPCFRTVQQIVSSAWLSR